MQTNLMKLRSPLLLRNGLNMTAVFNLSTLPKLVLDTLRGSIVDISSFSQILIFAHAGKDMWNALQQSPFKDAKESIDSFSKAVVGNYFKQELTDCEFQVIYPQNEVSIDLLELGKLAGWHHPSPFRVGINDAYGPWFAYRVVVLANTSFDETQKYAAPSPCDTCTNKACITNCPSNALDHGDLSLQICLNYRLSDKSKCASTCLSRLACPVAKEHRYSKEQMKYHYGVSLNTVLASTSTGSDK